MARRPFGGAWSASIDISPSPANVQSLSLSVRADGFAWVAWADTRSGNQDIRGSRYDPGTATWSSPLRLDDDPGSAAQQSPAVAFGPGEALAAWRDNRLSANGDTQARRLVFTSGLTDHFALSYDGLNRLTQIAGPVAESFTLDGPSNITSRTGPTQSESYDQSNRLTSDGAQSYTWSDADRLTSRGTDTFGYDPLDRMTSSNVAGAARSYAYNGDGMLQSRTGLGANTFLWDPRSSPNALVKQGSDNVVYGIGPLYVIRGDTTTVTFALDGVGSVRSELNGSGTPTAAFRYRTHGSIAQATAVQPSYLGYTTQLVDGSGLVYMRARWYDANVARFLTRDPAVSDPTRPSTLNAFLYAAANPVRNVDPTGKWCATLGYSGMLAGSDMFLGQSFGFAAQVSFGGVFCAADTGQKTAGAYVAGGAFAGGRDAPSTPGGGTGNEAHGLFAGASPQFSVSPQAQRPADLNGNFRNLSLSLGAGLGSGGGELAEGTTDDGRHIDVYSANLPVPVISPGLGAALVSQQTYTLTQQFWSDPGGWGLTP